MYLGLELALTGMGTVFLFLVLLIFVTTIMSRLVKRLETSHSVVSKPGFQPAGEKSKPADKAEMPAELLTAIVTAAIHKHRSRNRK